jgi:hypothetical protein
VSEIRGLTPGNPAVFGDVDGLRRTAEGLREAAGELESRRRALSATVDQLVGSRQTAASAVVGQPMGGMGPPTAPDSYVPGARVPAGSWSGMAASNFKLLWGSREDLLARLAAIGRDAGVILDGLARELAWAADEAEGARQAAEAAGLTVDAGYRIVRTAAPGCDANPEARTAFTARAVAAAQTGFDAAFARADLARLAAKVALEGLLAPGWRPLARTADELDPVYLAAAAPAMRAEGLASRLKRAETALARAEELRASGPRGEDLGRARRAAADARESVRVLGEATGKARALADGSPVRAVVGLGEKRVPGFKAIPGLRQVPVAGVVFAVGGSALDVSDGVPMPRAIAANTGAVLATTAATGVVATAVTASAPAWVAVGSVIVVGYGVGSAVHGLIAYGDVTHDFVQDWDTIKEAPGWVGDRAGAMASTARGDGARTPAGG